MSATRPRVGITGLGIICAAGRGADEFWGNVVAGRSAIGVASTEELAGFANPVVGHVPDEWLAELFTEEERERYDRAALLAIEAARQAVGSSGLRLTPQTASRVGIVLGKCQGTPSQTTADYEWIHLTCDHTAGYLGLRGPEVVVSTACAAGANALGIGRDRLCDGDADVMLAGGVDVLLGATYAGFHALQALSGRPCAPYSRSEGLNLGEGAAFLVMERIDDAEAAGRTVLAEFLGCGLSADAYHATAPDPTGRGAATAVRRALDDAGLTPDDVSYVNGHGTGTPANDRMERKVMRAVFGPRAGTLPISGTKSFVGHTLGASGAVEALTSVLAIRDQTLPPTANFDQPDDEFDFVPNVGRRAEVDVVVSNNYAFGGNNASIVLARPNRRRGPAPVEPARVMITGFGPVGPLGLGIGAWEQAFAEGRSAVGPIRTFDTSALATSFGAEMPALEPGGFASPKQWRHMNELTRQCVAATKLACDDAGLELARPERDDMGLVFATGFGPVNDALAFASGASAGSLKVSTFANITINAPAGAVCLAFGFRGPTTTIASGSASAHIALLCATDLIRQRKVPTVIIVAADELGPDLMRVREMIEGRHGSSLTSDGILRPYDEQRTGTAMGQAAVAVVLEDRDHVAARGGRAYAEVGSLAIGGHPYHPVHVDPSGEPYAAVVTRAIRQAGIDTGDVGYCAGAASGHIADEAEARALSMSLKPATLVSAPRALTGDCEAATGAVNLMACALAVSGRDVPPLINTQALIPEATFTPVAPGATRVGVRHALATVMAFGGNYGAAVVSAAED